MLSGVQQTLSFCDKLNHTLNVAYIRKGFEVKDCDIEGRFYSKSFITDDFYKAQN
jgi:hypothetical protein